MIFKPWCAALTLLLLMLPASAFAYVDPGSGMILWQGLIAAVGIALAFIRSPWKTLRSWLARFVRRK